MSDIRYLYITILTRYRTSENDLRYRDTILNSISKVLTFDIECSKSWNPRYRRQKHSMHYDIEEKSISNFFKSISTHHDIEDLRFDIEGCVLRYLCFFAWVAVARCPVLDTYCRVNYSLRIKRLACGLRLWNRLTRATRRSESARSRVEMPFRSAPLKLRRRLTIPPPRGEWVA
jgi:hypothetical protein